MAFIGFRIGNFQFRVKLSLSSYVFKIVYILHLIRPLWTLNSGHASGHTIYQRPMFIYVIKFATLYEI